MTHSIHTGPLPSGTPGLSAASDVAESEPTSSPVVRDLHITITAVDEETWLHVARQLSRLAANFQGEATVETVTMADDRLPVLCGRVHRVTGKRCQEAHGHSGCQGEPA